MQIIVPAEQPVPRAAAGPLIFDCDHWMRADCLLADLAEVERDYLHDAFGIAELSFAPWTLLDCSPGIGALARRVALRTPTARIVCLYADDSSSEALRGNLADLCAVMVRACNCPAIESRLRSSPRERVPQISREFGLQTIDLARLDVEDCSEPWLPALCQSPLVKRIVGRVKARELLAQCAARHDSSWRLHIEPGVDATWIYALVRSSSDGAAHARNCIAPFPQGGERRRN